MSDSFFIIFAKTDYCMKAKTLFLTDLMLLLTLVPVVVSGFGLHWAGHQINHELWHNWAVAHISSATLFAIITVVHIYGHWGWYKSLFKSGVKSKSRVTIALTALMLMVVATGAVVLVSHQMPNVGVGRWHYILGIILMVVAVGHFVRRHNTLFKGLKNVLK